MMQFLTLVGGDLLGLYTCIGLCGRYILRLFKLILLTEVLTLSYIFILTPVLCCCKPCILNTTSSVPAVPSSSQCTKIGIFEKKLILRKIIIITATKCYWFWYGALYWVVECRCFNVNLLFLRKPSTTAGLRVCSAHWHFFRRTCWILYWHVWKRSLT